MQGSRCSVVQQVQWVTLLTDVFVCTTALTAAVSAELDAPITAHMHGLRAELAQHVSQKYAVMGKFDPFFGLCASLLLLVGSTLFPRAVWMLLQFGPVCQTATCGCMHVDVCIILACACQACFHLSLEGDFSNCEGL